MQLVYLYTPEDVDAFLQENPIAGIFKAGTCHKTTQGFTVLQNYFTRYDLPVGVIRVVEQRPASNHVANISGILHQSPQFLLFREGKTVFDIDNWNITADAVAPAFQRFVPPREETSTEVRGDLTPYKTLLTQYLDGQLSDALFQDRYVNTFRDDASLRSGREFELLSRLFGDPDAYHGGLHQLTPASQRNDLQQAATQLLADLNAL